MPTSPKRAEPRRPARSCAPPARRRRSALSLALGLAALSSTLSSANTAEAFCRTAVCGEQAGQVCTPPSANDCGTPLYWGKRCLSYSLQQDASLQVDLLTAELVMDQAFDAWENADCGGTGPGLAAINFGPVSCSETEYNQEAGNANVVIFRDGTWPYVGQGSTLALTTVTFSLDTGEIFDADLEVNSTGSLVLTVGDEDVQYDLLSILTHEAGHMLGLAHSSVDEATMTVEYVPGDTSLRDLHPDDAAAVCATFPPSGEDLASCDPEPRHGFSTVCGDDAPPAEGCSCHIGPRPTNQGWLAIVAMGLGIGVRRRRRR